MIIGAVVFAAVGIAIGFIFPPLAPAFAALGVKAGLVTSVANGTYAPWILEGAMYGLFGLLVPPVQRLVNHFTGDDAAKAASEQQRENTLLEHKCAELESRIEQQRNPRAVDAILARGSRASQSYASAEEARNADIAAPTLH